MIDAVLEAGDGDNPEEVEEVVSHNGQHENIRMQTIVSPFLSGLGV